MNSPRLPRVPQRTTTGFAFSILDRALREAAVLREFGRKEMQRVLSHFPGDSPSCVYCGSTEVERWDHVVPIRSGGATVLGNVVLACQPCDDSKGDRDAESWMRSDAPKSPMSRGIDDIDARMDRIRAYAAAHGYTVEAGRVPLSTRQEDELSRLRSYAAALRRRADRFVSTLTGAEAGSIDGGAAESFKAAVAAAAPGIKCAKSALWPQHDKTGDLHEVNYAFHLARGLESMGAVVYFEVPFDDSGKRRLDLLAVHEHGGWAIAIEAKCLLSQNTDEGMANDVRKLSELRLRRSSGSIRVDELRCYTALLASTWRADFERWWCDTDGRVPSPPDAKRDSSWGVIRGFLDDCATGCVSSIDLRTRAPHWLLYGLRAESDVGVFWR